MNLRRNKNTVTGKPDRTPGATPKKGIPVPPGTPRSGPVVKGKPPKNQRGQTGH